MYAMLCTNDLVAKEIVMTQYFTAVISKTNFIQIPCIGIVPTVVLVIISSGLDVVPRQLGLLVDMHQSNYLTTLAIGRGYSEEPCFRTSIWDSDDNAIRNQSITFGFWIVNGFVVPSFSIWSEHIRVNSICIEK